MIINVEIDTTAPVFIPSTTYVYNIVETNPVNFTLGTILATDNDLRGQIIYEVTGVYPGVNFFEVDSVTGRVYIKTDLKMDYQATTQYRVSLSNI